MKNAKNLLALFAITPTDIQRIRNYGEIVVPNLTQFIDLFYLWLEKQPEFATFFINPKTLEGVKKSQLKYWTTFFKANIDETYVSGRYRVGKAHAEINLALELYLAASNKSLSILTEDLYDGSLGAEQFAKTIASISKLINLDSCIIVDSFTFVTNEIVIRQNQALKEMSTPVMEVQQDLLMLPVVGIVDSKRSQDIMAVVLEKIKQTQAKVIILDISGVAIVDTAVANYFIKLTQATQLMGCECILSGISSTVAQTIVELEIEIGLIKTTSDLKKALMKSFQIL